MDRHRAALSGPHRRPRFGPTELKGSLVLLFLGAMVLWPLSAILLRSFAGVGIERIGGILGRPSVWHVVGFTVGQAALSTAVTLVIGLPIALAVARIEFPGRTAIRSLVIVPFVLPTVVVAAAFRALFGSLGMFEQSLVAIIAAHVFFNVAVVVRITGGAWARLDPRYVEAARALGASPWQAFRRVTLPALRPALTASALLAFLFCFTSYGVILVLGGPTRSTLETEIQRYAVFRQEFDVAAVLALLQMIVVATLAIVAARLQRGVRRRTGSARSRDSRRRPLNAPGSRLIVALAVVLVALVVVAPLVSLVASSLRTGSGYGLANYRRLLETSDALPVSPIRALANSLGFAALAALVACVCGLASARSIASGGVAGRLVAVVSIVPLGVSAVTLGFGYLVGFARFDLRRSVWLIPLAHSIIGLPFVLASLVPALGSIPDRLRQVAATLGASPRQVVRRVERPILRRAMVTGAGFAMAVSIGEFGATSFLSRSGAGFTAPLAVFRLLSRPGTILRGQALALSVVIGAVAGLIALALELRGEV